MLDRGTLRETADRGIRLVALTLVTRVEDACTALEASAERFHGGSPGTDELLHDFRVALRRLRSWLRAFDPWLRDSLPRNTRDRLCAILRDTNAARDATVHSGFTVTGQHDGPAKSAGYTWLRGRLQAQRIKASDDALAAAEKFQRRAPKLRSRLDVRDAHELHDESFGAALAQVINAAAATLQTRLARVHELSDVREAHRARIAAKRLRYLIEPVVSLVKNGESLVSTLKSLQDSFGELHDLHVFSAQLAGASRKAARRSSRRRATLEPGLVDLERQLQDRREQVFEEITRQWLSGSERKIFDRVQVFAHDLGSTESSGVGRKISRKRKKD